MESAGYIAMRGLIIQVATGEVLEVSSPAADCEIRDFVPSPDASLIGTTSWCDTETLRVDIYDVEAGEFIASWADVDMRYGLARNPDGPRWSANGDFYGPTIASTSKWLRFDGGLADPVEVDEMPCYYSPLTTSGVVNSMGQGLCSDDKIELCVAEVYGEPIQIFGCP